MSHCQVQTKAHRAYRIIGRTNKKWNIYSFERFNEAFPNTTIKVYLQMNYFPMWKNNKRKEMKINKTTNEK